MLLFTTGADLLHDWHFILRLILRATHALCSHMCIHGNAEDGQVAEFQPPNKQLPCCGHVHATSRKTFLYNWLITFCHHLSCVFTCRSASKGFLELMCAATHARRCVLYIASYSLLHANEQQPGVVAHRSCMSVSAPVGWPNILTTAPALAYTCTFL